MDPKEERAALLWKIRDQAETIILQKDVIKTARADSVKIELLRGTTIHRLEWDNAWLKDQLPRWYEKPTFTVPFTALVVIYAVLKAVSISV